MFKNRLRSGVFIVNFEKCFSPFFSASIVVFEQVNVCQVCKKYRAERPGTFYVSVLFRNKHSRLYLILFARMASDDDDNGDDDDDGAYDDDDDDDDELF